MVLYDRIVEALPEGALPKRDPLIQLTPQERQSRIQAALEALDAWWTVSRNATTKGYSSNIVFRLRGKLCEGGTTLPTATSPVEALENGLALALGVRPATAPADGGGQG